MKLILAGGVQHLGENGELNAIFGVDIHPSGDYLATGGADCFLKVWDLKNVIKEKNTNLLHFQRNLQGSVSCVRWSPTGKYLACTSDDFIGGVALKIWEKEIKSTEGGKEHWKEIRSVKKHDKDITGVCWSPDETMIATCSLDNTIIVYNIAEKRVVKKIEENAGFIKGVSWDPIGKYIASHTGNGVRLWAVGRWTQEHEIRIPFSSKDEAMFYKLDWSPEGSHLVACNGENEGQKTAVIIQRGAWNEMPRKDFVGHTQATTAVRFNPLLYTTKKNVEPFGYCAVGDLNGKISLWSSTSSKAIVVVENMLNNAVQDITWSPDGRICVACSTSGDVALFHLPAGELGTPLSTKEMEEKLKDIYGATVGSSSIIENVEQMKYEMDRPDFKPIVGVDTKENLSSVVEIDLMDEEEDADLPEFPMDVEDVVEIQDEEIVPAPATGLYKDSISIVGYKQDEEILTSGKRRITPFFLGDETSANIVPAKALIAASVETSNTEVKPSTNEKKSKKGKKADSVLQKRKRRPKDSSNSSTPPTQTESRAKSGNRRIQPISVSSSSVPTISSSSPPSKKQKTSQNTNSSAVHRPKVVSKNTSQSRKGVNTYQKLMLLDVPPEVDNVKFILASSEENGVPLTFVASAIRTHGLERGILKCSHQARLEWRQLIDGKPSLLVVTKVFVALACRNGYLHVFTISGRRLFPAISLGSPISFLEPDGDHHLLAITCKGKLFVWDILKQQNILVESIEATLLHPNTSIKRARLSSTQQPIIITSSGECFTLDPCMKVWISVANNTFSRSCYQSVLPSTTLSINPNSLGALQASTSQLSTIDPPFSSPTQLQQTENLSHINNQVVCSLALQSSVEYEHWLMIFVRRLTEEGNEAILKELCTQMKGHASGKILGLSCEKLLSNIIKIIASNRKLQPLVERFTKPVTVELF